MIKTEAEFEEALKQLWKLMDAEPDSQEETELKRLATLVKTYEDEHYPIEFEKETP